jgi:hypothetical protein
MTGRQTFAVRFRARPSPLLLTGFAVAVLAALGDGTKLGFDGIEVVAFCGGRQLADLKFKLLG